VNCEQCSEWASDYLEGLLSRPRRATMDAHLASCDRCRTLVAELRAIPQLVRRATQVTMPTGAQQRLMRRVRGARKDKG
jgi:anti-sigma factor RsiW